MAVLRICALLLLFDCQEAFHCCLDVACINIINMISIECHRSGERCPGKREFDNRIEINRVRSGEIMWLFPLTDTSSIGLQVETADPVWEARGQITWNFVNAGNLVSTERTLLYERSHIDTKSMVRTSDEN